MTAWLAAARASPHRAALAGIVAVLSLFFAIAFAILVADQRDSALSQSRDLWSQELRMAGMFVTEDMLGHRFDHVEQSLKELARLHGDIVSLKASAPNGFTVVDHRRPDAAPEDHTLTLAESVVAGGSHLLRIEASFDLGPTERRIRLLGIWLVVVTAVFMTILGVLLWLAIKHLALIPLERSRAAMLESERRYRNLVELSPDAICVHDHGRIVFINPAAAALFGAAHGDTLLDRPIAELIHPGDRDILLSSLRVNGATEPDRCPAEGRLIRLDGRTVPFDLVSMPVVFSGTAATQCVFRDITARKHVEKVLITAKDQAELNDRVKSDFLANMSHELRTPLNAIIGFSDAMLAGIAGPVASDKQTEYLRNIHESGRHLLDVINDILDVAKIEAGRLDLAEEPVDLVKTIESAQRLVGKRAQGAGIDLRVHVTEAPMVLGDRRRILQILLNLLGNAVKFTRDGCVAVTVEVTADGGLELAIADSGIGMSPGDIAKAMEPFGQVDQALSRRFEGTGLGLPLTKALVEMHDGVMYVESEPGIGTAVAVVLPPSRILG